jgi:putative metalloprotease
LDSGAQYDAGVAVAAAVLSKVLGGGNLANAALGAGASLARNGYSREQEVEADDFGTEYCARGGYSSWGLYDAIRRMSDAGLVTPPDGFNSHPPTERRLSRLRADAEKWEKESGKVP